MIYSVEDDAQIREMVLYALKQSDLSAEGFPEAGVFWKAVAKQKPSLVLLDIMLPGENGLTILKRLRDNPETRDIPIIMLTAKSEEMERVKGLNMGADDYISKPFSVLELVARVKALLRRTKQTGSKQFMQIGDIQLDEETYGVLVGGEPVSLTIKEFELLAYLMRYVGAACSRERLYAAVWDDIYAGNTRTVDVHVQTLRQKLGEAGKYIETIRGLGYRMRSML